MSGVDRTSIPQRRLTSPARLNALTSQRPPQGLRLGVSGRRPELSAQVRHLWLTKGFQSLRGPLRRLVDGRQMSDVVLTRDHKTVRVLRSDGYDAIGGTYRLGAVGDHHPGGADIAQRLVNFSFTFDVEVAGSFVQQQNTGTPVQRT